MMPIINLETLQLLLADGTSPAMIPAGTAVPQGSDAPFRAILALVQGIAGPSEVGTGGSATLVADPVVGDAASESSPNSEGLQEGPIALSGQVLLSPMFQLLAQIGEALDAAPASQEETGEAASSLLARIGDLDVASLGAPGQTSGEAAAVAPFRQGVPPAETKAVIAERPVPAETSLPPADTTDVRTLLAQTPWVQGDDGMSDAASPPPSGDLLTQAPGPVVQSTHNGSPGTAAGMASPVETAPSGDGNVAVVALSSATNLAQGDAPKQNAAPEQEAPMPVSPEAPSSSSGRSAQPVPRGRSSMPANLPDTEQVQAAGPSRPTGSTGARVCETGLPASEASVARGSLDAVVVVSLAQVEEEPSQPGQTVRPAAAMRGFEANGTVSAARAAPEQTTGSVEPTTARDVTDWVVQSVRYTVSHGYRTVRVRLIPESLGELTVEVASNGDSVHVRLSSTNMDVRHVLEERLPVLRILLAREGVEATHVVVSCDPAPAQVFGGSSGGAAWRFAQSAKAPPASVASAGHGSAESSATPVRRPAAHQGYLDVYV